jgi:hypothetical protein
LRLLRANWNPDVDIDIGKTLATTREQVKYSSASNFHFYHYAKEFWFNHTQSIPDDDIIVSDFVVKLQRRAFEKRASPLERWI